VQVAVTLVLLAGAGLFARSLMTALKLNADVGMSNVVIANVSLVKYGYTRSAHRGCSTRCETGCGGSRTCSPCRSTTGKEG
jgi:hypothetical protein